MIGGLKHELGRRCQEVTEAYFKVLYGHLAGPGGRAVKAWVCGRSPAEIMGSNPAGGMDVRLLWVLCVVS